MFEHLDSVVKHYEEVMAGLSDPYVTGDPEKFRAMMKEQASLQPLVEAYRAYCQAVQDQADAKHLLETENDEDMRAMAKEELSEGRAREEELTGS